MGWASAPGGGIRAFVWDAASGMQDLEALLADDYDLDLTGWKLEEALGICADGRLIVGTADSPSGTERVWVARLDSPAPPVPALPVVGVVALTAMLAGTGGWLARRRRLGA